MSLEDERRRMFAAVNEKPYDMDRRKVLADWLEEYGTLEDDPETAVEQRNWTTEKQHCLDHLKTVASDLDMDYSDLLDMAEKFLLNGRSTHFGFDTPVSLYNMPRFWAAYEIITGKKVEDDNKQGSFFRCSC